MRGLVSTAGPGTSTKLIGVTKHTKHGHVPSPVSPHFVAPPVQPVLSFNSIALAAAIARTATTWDDAPVVLLDGLQQGALIELETLLQDGSTFALESHFKFLADTAGSQFAAKIGAGIAHLYMDAPGYAWRANAACLSSSLDPHADFIYEGGNASGHGVVLAEAHGSFAKDASAAKVANAAKRKYVKQVKPFVAKPSPFGEVIHGYSIAFGSKPTTAGSFLAVSETRISKPRKQTPPPSGPQRGAIPEGTSAPMALATHRSNFLLMGAPEVTDWIDWIRSPESPAPEGHGVSFLRFGYAGRTYLAGPSRLLRPGGPPWWTEDFFEHPEWWRLARRTRLSPSRHPSFDFGWFAIEEKAAAKFLNALSNAIRDRAARLPATMRLPTVEPTGFSLCAEGRIARADADEPDRYALFRDGLALLGEPFRGRPRDVVVWSPEGGMALD
ncbi:hypothetical protein [Sphingobium sp.]|uniref:hypothetical protein n=1 Tax=Sphingobium sp. TaxID=1912891 RepID=UPI002C8A034E|nr:hypothetical protein [Sphingobium sp.]HUD92783.1 hypothetical protein [Sphingobium sp.]